MKYIFTLLLAVSLLSTTFAQTKNIYGEKFAFDAKNELDPHFVLKDNYNQYLLTVLDAYDLPNGHQVILRKFDQKNNLVDVLKADMPKLDIGTMYQYIGFTESPNGKVAVFVEVHSGRSATSQICKIEFDKATAKFTTTTLATNPIPSLMKSGDLYSEKSSNEKYLALSYHFHRDKNGADKTLFIVIDATTLNVAWQKEVSFTDDYVTANYTVTNSGKVVLERDMKGSKKGITYLTVVTADGQENKSFDTQIFFNEMKSVSIGADEYLLALNSNAKNFRDDYFSSLALYDLKSGRILNNTKIKELSGISDLYEVNIVNVSLQNNEMHVFAEGKVKLPYNPNAPIIPGKSITDYAFKPALLIVLSLDGQLKTVKKLYTDPNSKAELYHSFGVANIRGTYYINTGNYNGVYTLNASKNFDNNPSIINFYQGDPYGSTGNRFLNQLFTYFADKNSLLMGRTFSTNEMSLVSVANVVN